VGNALKIVPERSEIWDLVFIDANKQEYIEYFEMVIDRVRPGGLILTDNVLWSGKVVYERNDVDARVIHRYNEMLFRDPRVEVLILPIRDGISVARKKA
jgi:predicted O-methyltransferase YrrM